MRNLLTSFTILLSASTAAAAGRPVQLVHSGRLVDSEDKPVTADMTLTFRLWNHATDVDPETNLVWPAGTPPECALKVNRGLYSVVLGGAAHAGGCGGALTTTDLPFDAPRFLEVSINGAPLLPRLRLGTMPTAALASAALDADALGGEPPASYHDAARLTGVAPESALAKAILSVTGDAPLSVTRDGTALRLTLPAATADAPGYLAPADFAAFKAKADKVVHDGTLAGEGTAANPLGATVGTTSGTLAAGDDARFASLAAANAALASTAAANQTDALAAAARAKSEAIADTATKLGAYSTTAQVNSLVATATATAGPANGFFNAANAPATCDASAKGAIYFNTGDNTFRGCNGTAWVKFSAGNAACGATSDTAATSCKAIKNNADCATVSGANGTFWISPGGTTPIQLYCDMTTDGGGWTLVLKSDSTTHAIVRSAAAGGISGTIGPTITCNNGGDQKISDAAMKTLWTERSRMTTEKVAKRAFSTSDLTTFPSFSDRCGTSNALNWDYSGQTFLASYGNGHGYDCGWAAYIISNGTEGPCLFLTHDGYKSHEKSGDCSGLDCGCGWGWVK